jgi:YggT family protein
LAAITAGSDTTMLEVYAGLSKALDIYLALLTARVLLTWFRNISWTSEPFNTIRQFTDPYLNVFRGIVPPLGGIDLSPMLGFFILSFAAKQLRRMAMGY